MTKASKDTSYSAPNTDQYQRMRAELYMKQNPGVTLEEALRVVNSR